MQLARPDDDLERDHETFHSLPERKRARRLKKATAAVDHPESTCPQCRYDIGGIFEDDDSPKPCPECGTVVSPAIAVMGWWRKRRAYNRNTCIAAFSGLVQAALAWIYILLAGLLGGALTKGRFSYSLDPRLRRERDRVADQHLEHAARDLPRSAPRGSGGRIGPWCSREPRINVDLLLPDSAAGRVSLRGMKIEVVPIAARKLRTEQEPGARAPGTPPSHPNFTLASNRPYPARRCPALRSCPSSVYLVAAITASSLNRYRVLA